MEEGSAGAARNQPTKLTGSNTSEKVKRACERAGVKIIITIKNTINDKLPI